MSQLDRARPLSTRRVNKFTFSDYRFAAFVRERMMEVLSQFDSNQNHYF